MSDNGWEKYGYFVLKELKEIKSEQKDMRKDVRELVREVAALKVKSGVWGLIAGAIPAGLIGLWMWVRNKLGG